MTGDDARPGTSGPPDADPDLERDDVRDDGPVIDPRDPLGLGDLPLRDDALDADPLHAATARELAARTPGGPTAHASEVAGVAADRAVLDGSSRVADDVTVDAPVPHGDGRETEDGDDVAAAADGPGGDGVGADPSSAAPPTASGEPPTTSGAAPTDRPTGVTGPAPRSGWSRLAHAMRPRTTQGQLLTAALCALLGFALVVQVRQTSDTQLGSLRQNDLVRLLDETTTRTDELEQESLDLQRERDELLSGSDRQQAALDAARRTAAMQGILTGRLPATGPGVRITLTEPDGEIRPATMVHVLEELRNAGAEAMELNDHRITASSAFTGTRGAVELDGTVLQSPFRWTVIGDPDTIAPALEIPGGALVRVRLDGGRGTVEKSDQVEVQATRVLTDPVHASPAPDAG